MLLCGFPSTGLAGEHEVDVYYSSCDTIECESSFCQRLAFYEDPIFALSSQAKRGVLCEASETSTTLSSIVQHTTHGIAAELMIDGCQHAFLPEWVSVLC